MSSVSIQLEDQLFEIDLQPFDDVSSSQTHLSTCMPQERKLNTIVNFIRLIIFYLVVCISSFSSLVAEVVG